MAETQKTVEMAARVILDIFALPKHPEFVEMVIPPIEGRLVTSGQFETAIRREAASRRPSPDVRGLRVELKSVHSAKGVVHVVRGLG